MSDHLPYTSTDSFVTFKKIVEDNNDSYAFRYFVEEAILSGWLRPYDILVCGNAAIHEKGYNCDLSHFLWDTPSLDGEPLNILLLPLPTRSPELNPIELIWHIMVQRLRGVQRRVNGNHKVARCAEIVLDEIDFGVVRRTYRHCGYKNF